MTYDELVEFCGNERQGARPHLRARPRFLRTSPTMPANPVGINARVPGSGTVLTARNSAPENWYKEGFPSTLPKSTENVP